MKSNYIWFNGELVAYDDARIHIATHGLHYSGAVFEGIKAYNGKVFKLREHSERFINSAKMIDMQIPYSVEQLNEAIKNLISKSDIQNAYIRPIAWRSGDNMKIEATGCGVDVAIMIKESAAVNFGEKGLRLAEAKYKRPSPEFAPVSSKASCLYTTSTICKRDAQARGYDDALMLDFRGNVCELTVANIFFIKDEQLYTPIPDCCLPGITRATIIEIAKANNINVAEHHITPAEIKDFDGCFVTGTAVEIKWVEYIEVNGCDIKFEKHQLINFFSEKYRELVLL